MHPERGTERKTVRLGGYDIPVRQCPNRAAPFGTPTYKDATDQVFTCIQPCTPHTCLWYQGKLNMGLSHTRKSCRHQEGGTAVKRDSCESAK